MPAFLFVPPLPIKYIHGMHCVEYPLPESPFYWSLEQAGRTRIPEDELENFNIPKLELKTWIGSYWDSYHYTFVRDFLGSIRQPLDGRQYAGEHGHPELIQGD